MPLTQWTSSHHGSRTEQQQAKQPKVCHGPGASPFAVPTLAQNIHNITTGYGSKVDQCLSQGRTLRIFVVPVIATGQNQWTAGQPLDCWTPSPCPKVFSLRPLKVCARRSDLRRQHRRHVKFSVTGTMAGGVEPCISNDWNASCHRESAVTGCAVAAQHRAAHQALVSHPSDPEGVAAANAAVAARRRRMEKRMMAGWACFRAVQEVMIRRLTRAIDQWDMGSRSDKVEWSKASTDIAAQPLGCSSSA